MSTHLKFLAVPITIAALLAGCGGGDDSADDSAATEATQTEKPTTGQTAGATIELQADPSGALAYQETSLSGKAGTLSIDFTNDSPTGHDVVIEQDGKETARSSIITQSSEVVTFDAKPGDYTFYCSLPGHREAGMEGTLTVSK